MATKTISKPAPVKAPSKAPSKAAAKPATKAATKATSARVPAGPVSSMADAIAANAKKGKPFAGLLLAALSGEFGPSAQRFYKSALSYHGKRATSFPRKPMGTIEPKEAIAYVKSGPVAGNGFSQRLFDRMVVESFGGAK